jgi:hypothetical protein
MLPEPLGKSYHLDDRLRRGGFRIVLAGPPDLVKDLHRLVDSLQEGAGFATVPIMPAP